MLEKSQESNIPDSCIMQTLKIASHVPTLKLKIENSKPRMCMDLDQMLKAIVLPLKKNQKRKLKKTGPTKRRSSD